MKNRAHILLAWKASEERTLISITLVKTNIGQFLKQKNLRLVLICLLRLTKRSKKTIWFSSNLSIIKLCACQSQYLQDLTSKNQIYF